MKPGNGSASSGTPPGAWMGVGDSRVYGVTKRTTIAVSVITAIDAARNGPYSRLTKHSAGAARAEAAAGHSPERSRI